MSLRRRALVPLALALTGLLALPACSSESRSDTLTIYSSRTKNLLDPLLQRYTKETGERLDVRYGDAGDLALQIDEEGDTSPADVFLTQSPGALDDLSGKGRLADLPAPVLDQVDASFRSATNQWVGLSGRVRVLVYNTDELGVGDLPASVIDLTDPSYQDQVAVAPTNGSFQDFVTTMRKAVGDARTLAWLQDLQDNGARTYADNASIVQAVARGDVAMGLVNHYYLELAKVEDPDVAAANHQFEPGDLGNLILVTAIGTLKTADSPDKARAFIDFLLGAEAQGYFAEQTLEYPLAAGVQPAVDLPPLASIQAPQQDLSTLGDLAVTAQLIRESGLATA